MGVLDFSYDYQLGSPWHLYIKGIGSYFGSLSVFGDRRSMLCYGSIGITVAMEGTDGAGLCACRNGYCRRAPSSSGPSMTTVTAHQGEGYCSNNGSRSRQPTPRVGPPRHDRGLHRKVMQLHHDAVENLHSPRRCAILVWMSPGVSDRHRTISTASGTPMYPGIIQPESPSYNCREGVGFPGRCFHASSLPGLAFWG